MPAGVKLHSLVSRDRSRKFRRFATRRFWQEILVYRVLYKKVLRPICCWAKGNKRKFNRREKTQERQTAKGILQQTIMIPLWPNILRTSRKE